MSARIDFLVGLLAVQTGLVDAVSFADLCLERGPDAETPLAQDMAERGMLRAADRVPLEQIAYRVLAVAPHDGQGHTSMGSGPVAAAERYAYLDELGRGGMGTVHRAHDARLDRDVAIKELLPRWAADEGVRARFFVEARTTGQLQHPGVVPVYDLLPAGQGHPPRYTMRLVPGRTFREAVHDYHVRRRAGQEVSRERTVLLSAFVSVCQTMAYAHSRGVLHRDLKPDNVRLGEFGEAIVLDWGLAKRFGKPDPARDEDESNLTRPGQFVGTPNYVSPEQAVGDLDHLDGRSDVYSLGAILYEILAGRPPFVTGSMTELLRQVQTDVPPPLRLFCQEVPPALENVCMRAMAKKPEDRYQTASDLAAAVLQWQENERREAELRYRTLVEAVPQIVWVARPDGFVTYFNHKSHEVPGGTWREETFLGNGWRDHIYPADVAGHRTAWEDAQTTGEAFQSQHRMRMPDGAYRWFLARAVPLRDGEGRIAEWFGTTTDVHELKQAVHDRDEALRQMRAQEAESRRILDLIPHIVWTMVPQDGNSFLNRRWYEYTGLSEQESAGADRWMKVLHPDDVKRTMRIWEACMQSGEPFEIEYRLRGADGEYRWFIGRGVPVCDPAGRLVRWFGTCTDVEERTQTQACEVELPG